MPRFLLCLCLLSCNSKSAMAPPFDVCISDVCRVHLSWLGFPIANDSQYGGTYKGPDQVRNHAAALRGQSEDLRDSDASISMQAHNQAVTELSDAAAPMHSPNKRQKRSAEVVLSRDMSDTPKSPADLAKGLTPGQLSAGQAHSSNKYAEADTCSPDCFLVPQILQDEMCLNCPNLIPPGYPTDIHPLWLHAQSYTCEHWAFVCSKPDWAGLNWTP